MTDEQDVERIALSLPETTKGEDGFSFAVHGKGFAWSYMERILPKKPRVRRPDVLAVHVVNEDEKELMIAANPSAFFTTDHYNGYPAVLVNLPAIDIDELEDLLINAWRCRAPRRLVKAFDAGIRTDSAVSSDEHPV